MRFLVYMYYTHSGYQTSIFGKNCAYYIQFFTVCVLLIVYFSCTSADMVNKRVDYCYNVLLLLLFPRW